MKSKMIVIVEEIFPNSCKCPTPSSISHEINFLKKKKTSFLLSSQELLSNEGVYQPFQYLSEIEMMEYILCQFQTGENIFLKKGLVNPALISVTQVKKKKKSNLCRAIKKQSITIS